MNLSYETPVFCFSSGAPVEVFYTLEWNDFVRNNTGRCMEERKLFLKSFSVPTAEVL
jgi:hypothetical protein